MNGLIAAPFATTRLLAIAGYLDQSNFQRRLAEEVKNQEAYTSTTPIRTTQSWVETSVSQEARSSRKYRVPRWKRAK
jgi:hypothetical protein